MLLPSANLKLPQAWGINISPHREDEIMVFMGKEVHIPVWSSDSLCVWRTSPGIRMLDCNHNIEIKVGKVVVFYFSYRSTVIQKNVFPLSPLQWWELYKMMTPITIFILQLTTVKFFVTNFETSQFCYLHNLHQVNINLSVLNFLRINWWISLKFVVAIDDSPTRAINSSTTYLNLLLRRLELFTTKSKIIVISHKDL